MGKGYRIVELSEINPLINNDATLDYAVALFHWLVEALHYELKERLNGIEIEVIPVASHASDYYPALGVHYKDITREDTKVEDLVHATATRLLAEKPVGEFIKFLAANETDWKARTNQLLEK